MESMVAYMQVKRFLWVQYAILPLFQANLALRTYVANLCTGFMQMARLPMHFVTDLIDSLIGQVEEAYSLQAFYQPTTKSGQILLDYSLCIPSQCQGDAPSSRETAHFQIRSSAAVLSQPLDLHIHRYLDRTRFKHKNYDEEN